MSVFKEEKSRNTELEHLKDVLMADLGLTQEDLDEVWRRYEAIR